MRFPATIVGSWGVYFTVPCTYILFILTLLIIYSLHLFAWSLFVVVVGGWTYLGTEEYWGIFQPSPGGLAFSKAGSRKGFPHLMVGTCVVLCWNKFVCSGSQPCFPPTQQCLSSIFHECWYDVLFSAFAAAVLNVANPQAMSHLSNGTTHKLVDVTTKLYSMTEMGNFIGSKIGSWCPW